MALEHSFVYCVMEQYQIDSNGREALWDGWLGVIYTLTWKEFKIYSILKDGVFPNILWEQIG